LAITLTTYNAQDDRAHDQAFIAKIRQAIVTNAIAVQAESLTTPRHANRATFAFQVLRDPTSWSQLIANGVASNAAIADDSPDSTILNIVIAQWDAYAMAIV